MLYSIPKCLVNILKSHFLLKINICSKHTSNPSTLRKFLVYKMYHKKLLRFLKNSIEISNLLFTCLRNTLKNIIHWTYVEILIYKISENMHFLIIFRYLQIQFAVKFLVLTKCWLKHYRSIRNLLLMSFIFWINTVSPKLKKIFDDTDLHPKKW